MKRYLVLLVSPGLDRLSRFRVLGITLEVAVSALTLEEDLARAVTEKLVEPHLLTEEEGSEKHHQNRQRVQGHSVS